MKRLSLIVGLSVLPVGVSAQSISGSTIPYTGRGTYCGSAGDSFTTTHMWKVQPRGTLVLEGTAFTIQFDAATFTFTLLYGGHPVPNGSADNIDALRRLGVAKARDLQEIGLLDSGK